MNGLSRFVELGLRDVDRRWQQVLERPDLAEADRYLRDSFIVRTIDRGTRHLSAWWTSAQTRQVLMMFDRALASDGWTTRYQQLAIVIITAVVTYVALTAAHHPPPGWSWMILPAMAAAFAALLFASSRDAH
jgi:hypothetical protein